MRAIVRGLVVGLLLAVAAILADAFTQGRVARAIAVPGGDPCPLVPDLSDFFSPALALALLAGLASARLGPRPAPRSFAAALVISLARGALTGAVLVAFGVATVARFSVGILLTGYVNFACGIGLATVAVALVETLAARRRPSRGRDAVAIALVVVIAPIAVWLATLQVAYVREIIQLRSISAAFAQVPVNARFWLSADRVTVWFLAQESLVLTAVSAARLRLQSPLQRVVASSLAGCAIIVLLGGVVAHPELGGVNSLFVVYPAGQVTMLFALAGAAVAEVVDRAIGARVAARFDPPPHEPEEPVGPAEPLEREDERR
jgi:hypothetical protein